MDEKKLKKLLHTVEVWKNARKTRNPKVTAIEFSLVRNANAFYEEDVVPTCNNFLNRIKDVQDLHKCGKSVLGSKELDLLAYVIHSIEDIRATFKEMLSNVHECDWKRLEHDAAHAFESHVAEVADICRDIMECKWAFENGKINDAQCEQCFSHCHRVFRQIHDDLFLVDNMIETFVAMLREQMGKKCEPQVASAA
jgi:hypothetical protein